MLAGIVVLGLYGMLGTPPNILILMSDDQRPEAIGKLAPYPLRTPNMDRLVESGRVFRHAYNLGSNQPAVCLPSRNMFLSGRTYFRWGDRRYAPADGPSLPRSFNTAGYDTFHVGKSGNVAREIEPLFTTSSYLEDEKERTSGEPGRESVDRAIAWLDDRMDDSPFLMYLAFEAPHDPRVAHERFRTNYVPRTIPLPSNFLSEHPFDNGELRVRDEKLASFPRTEEEIRSHLADYHAVLTGLDFHIGRLLAELEKRELFQNTLVVLTSDNGLAVGSHGLMGKQNLYEHSAGVPLVVSGPGIEPGPSNALVYLMDVFPTLCELASIPIPNDLDGESFASAIQNPTAKGREALLLTYREVQRAIRDQRWKLIVYPEIGRVQLFDLDNDPDELRDVSPIPEHAPRLATMLTELERLQASLGDPLKLDKGSLEKANRAPAE